MLNVLLCICMVVPLVVSGIDRPRGVPPSKASFYKPGETFTCITKGNIIPFDQVNDDYCDCEDGSDEPGTSACPMMKFYCENTGHKPEFILSSRYNDGICDCCDGSDEFGEEKIQCQNVCDEIGRADRENREKEMMLQTEGYKIKVNYITDGQRIQNEKKARLEQIEKEKEQYEVMKTELEAKKNEVEAPEKEAKDKHEKIWEEIKERKKAAKERETAVMAFQEIDSNDDQHVDISEMVAHPEFDIDSDGTVSNEEAKEYLEEIERVGQDDFVEKIWPNIKEIFKSKKVVEEVKEEETATDVPPPPVGEAETKEPESIRFSADGKPVGTSMFRIANIRPPRPSRLDDDDDDDDEDNDDWDGDGDRDESVDDDDMTDAPPSEDAEDKMPEYDDETKQLIAAADEARNEFSDAERKVRDSDTEISNLKQFLELDFGPQLEYSSLKGQCFEMTDREYTYKLCPFEKTSQRSKNGGSETSLGVWGHWEGSNSDSYSAMKYEKGQNCWNGPDRSVQVVLQCGTENTLLSASEPSRCEYRFDFATPARCQDLNQQPSQKDTHDEL